MHPAAKQNLAKMSVLDTYAEVVSASADMGMDHEPIASKAGGGDGLDHIVDIREYDIPYTIRVAIDKGIIRSNGKRMVYWEGWSLDTIC